MRHADLSDSGLSSHFEIDWQLPTPAEKALLEARRAAPVTVSGARDDPEAALANLLTVLAGLGLIVDDTTSTMEQ